MLRLGLAPEHLVPGSEYTPIIWPGTVWKNTGDCLSVSLALGFCHWTLADLSAGIAANSIAPDAKVFVHRHDIDTDVGGARAFFEIEKALGIRASYYFRLSTIDRDLMREINSYGSEVGYHYEELATHAKRYGLNTPAAALAHMDAITAEFERNFRSLEQSLGFKIKSVHCDTGQHFDALMSDVFFDELDIPKPSYNLEVNSLSHGAMTGRMLEKIEVAMLAEAPKMVLIYGDTNSTLAGALAAAKLHIPVA